MNYGIAIQVAAELIADEPDREKRRKARQVLSDRKANLATALIEKRELDIAFAHLEEALQMDMQTGNVAGWVNKQGALGQWYLIQKETVTAKMVFQTALDFIRNPSEDIFNHKWTPDDLVSACGPHTVSVCVAEWSS